MWRRRSNIPAEIEICGHSPGCLAPGPWVVLHLFGSPTPWRIASHSFRVSLWGAQRRHSSKDAHLGFHCVIPSSHWAPPALGSSAPVFPFPHPLTGHCRDAHISHNSRPVDYTTYCTFHHLSLGKNQTKPNQTKPNQTKKHALWWLLSFLDGTNKLFLWETMIKSPGSRIRHLSLNI